MLVDSSLDQDVSRCVDELKTRFGLERQAAMHWRRIKHSSMRRAIVDRIAREPTTLAYVVCDTSSQSIHSSTLRYNGRLYAYLLRLLLERLARFGRDKQETISLVLANRSNVSYSEVRNYMSRLQDDSSCRIEWNCLRQDRIRCIPAQQSKMLQVADVCLGACFNALEIDRYGYLR